MRDLFVAVAKAIFNVLYKLFSLIPRKQEVLFLSRQANTPSDDFITLGKRFEEEGFKSIYLVKKLSKRTAVSYIIHVLREIYHLARCKVCFLDRYDPVVSLIDFKYEDVVDYPGIKHNEFPIEPVVIQLWHAFGAFKRFGYQSLGTKEGHLEETAERFNIHRNYSWILCTGESSRQYFAEAFSYPTDRVLPLGRPELDKLKLEARSHDPDTSKQPVFLFAPTLRKSERSQHPFRDLYQESNYFFVDIPADLLWSFHPLEEIGCASEGVNELLLKADYIITDYSSIAYEAFLLNKKVLFYIPDIDNFRNSPGLNTDPLLICPGISYTNKDDLKKAMVELTNEHHSYDKQEFEAFVGDTFESCKEICATDRIVEFVLLRIH